jgi:hypothetical protein
LNKQYGTKSYVFVVNGDINRHNEQHNLNVWDNN